MPFRSDVKKGSTEIDFAKLIAIDQVSISFVAKSQVISSLLEYRHKCTPLPNYDAIFCCLKTVQAKMIEMIMESVNKAQSVTICSDEWTSRTNSSFLNIQTY